MEDQARIAFVTGGSGFIGGRLIERLRGDGYAVRALARSDRSASAVEQRGAEPVRGDLDDPSAIEAGARGCRVAFHLAAALGTWGEREWFERINVQGTENVLNACARAGVERFVHCSTEAVLLAGEPLTRADEGTPRRPDSSSLYSATKARAEEVVERASRDRLAATIVRPRFVWGRGDTTLLPVLAEQARSGRLRWVGGGRHLTSTTHVDNAAHGLMLAAAGGAAGEIYFVTDGEPVVFRDFVSELLRTQGVAPPTRSVPAPVARSLASGSELAWRILPLRGEPPLTRFAYWFASQECTLDDSKARGELGYSPVTTREQGLADLRERPPGT
ncbi:MAG TPA: NAD-dependent epimerase/dehydratase family protein [Thermoleophilaceae bacterium]|nr:NAD-dependent epimerase/dehydratase family protein [Thermoleophilaceae bacterium]